MYQMQASRQAGGQYVATETGSLKGRILHYSRKRDSDKDYTECIDSPGKKRGKKDTNKQTLKSRQSERQKTNTDPG